jgi:hypothetical protein
VRLWLSTEPIKMVSRRITLTSFPNRPRPLIYLLVFRMGGITKAIYPICDQSQSVDSDDDGDEAAAAQDNKRQR